MKIHTIYFSIHLRNTILKTPTLDVPNVKRVMSGKKLWLDLKGVILIIKSLEDFTALETLLSELDDVKFDNIFWRPIIDDPLAIAEFDKHINNIEESQEWDISKNHLKGAILEDFAVFLFSRFQDVKVSKNKRTGDNETDIETLMSEKAVPPFIKNVIGTKIVCECKNKKSSTIDVGMVSKLAEILPTRGSKFGIFISVKGMGGKAWRFGEGKRKKIMYGQRIPIISFTTNELKKLKIGKNLFTLIREKYYSLLDEVDDETSGIPTEEEDFFKYTQQMIRHLSVCNLLSDDEREELLSRAVKRYGDTE